MKISRVGILYHPLIEATQVEASEVSRLAREAGASAWVDSSWNTVAARNALDNTDIVLTIGGDGTMLRGVQVVTASDIPIVGINMGKLGFLTELSPGEVKEKLPAILSGQGWIDERSMLAADVPLQDGPRVNFNALNDVVVARGPVCQLISIEVEVGRERFTTYRTDGVVLATATGSTGYSLSAGGPILYPQSPDFIMVPLAPHLGLNHPLVLAASSEVSLRVAEKYQATISIDGHINIALRAGGLVKIRNSHHRVRFLRIHEPRFYGSLETKLRGLFQGVNNTKS